MDACLTTLPKTIADAGRRFRDRTLSIERLTCYYLDGVAALQPTLNAFITVTGDLARKAASILDDELKNGRDRGPLHGIPVVVKDDIDVANYPTTFGSALYRNRVPTADASVITRLKAAGAVILGKTNMNELAAGGKGGYNPHYGNTRNPWSLAHEPGGSSSGSAAAVAAQLCLCGIGTDSGGSVRGPADRCGVVGIRPTLGRVSKAGVFRRCRSFESVGAMARSVADAAILLSAIAGHDAADPSSLDIPDEDFSRELDLGVRGLRLAIVKNYSFKNVDGEIVSAVERALETFVSSGAVVEEINAPMFVEVLDPVLLADIIFYEFRESIGESYDRADRTLFGDIVHSDMKKAARITRQAYERALSKRKERAKVIGLLFERIDALVTPTSVRLPPTMDAPMDLSGDHRRFTIPVSYFGLPAISIPCGFSRSGLPIGMQITGNRLGESTILRIAAAFEQATPFHYDRPPIVWT